MKTAKAIILKIPSTSKPKTSVHHAMAFGCFVTVLVQVESRLSVVFTVFWFAFVLYLAVTYGGRAKFAGIPLLAVVLAVLLFIYCSACYLASGEFEFLTGFYQLYLKSLLMYLIGFFVFFSRKIDSQRWDLILAVYITAAFLYMAWAMANYFPGFSAWLSSEVYLFDEKNSLGQIAGVATIALMVMGFEQKSFTKRRIVWLLASGLAICILLIQCRTAALACCAALVFLLVFKRKKRMIIVLAAIVILCIAASPTLQNSLSHAFLLDKYQDADIDTLSSGRFSNWAEALDAIKGSELTGLGNYYVDNMYINLYANLGIIGFILFMCLWVPRVFVNFRRGSDRKPSKENGTLWLLAACLTAFYLIESLLEGYPPFGPGTCSFVFWMLCGYLDASGYKTVSPWAARRTRMREMPPSKEVVK